MSADVESVLTVRATDAEHSKRMARMEGSRTGRLSGFDVAARTMHDLHVAYNAVNSLTGGTLGNEWNALLSSTGLSATRLQGCLLILESDGLVERQPIPGKGTFYSRVAK